MEQLRSLSWAHAPGGGFLSDLTTNLAAEPLRPGGPGLSPAPAGVTRYGHAVYVDYANAAGARTPPARRRCVRAALVGRAARIRPAKPAGARGASGHGRRRRCTSHHHQGASPMIPATGQRDLPATPHTRPMMQGYMLIELLVVASIVCTVLAVVLRVCATAQNSVRTHGDSTDLQQRLRVAVEAIRRDLTTAGAGLSRGLCAVHSSTRSLRSCRRDPGSWARTQNCRTTPIGSASCSCPAMHHRQDCPSGWVPMLARCRSTTVQPDVLPTEPAASELAIGY